MTFINRCGFIKRILATRHDFLAPLESKALFRATAGPKREAVLVRLRPVTFAERG